MRLGLRTVLLILFLSSCGQIESRREILDSVWRIVNETYPDSTFGGIDWRLTGDRYRRRLVESGSDSEFYDLLNSMLFELNVSHAFFGPLSGIKRRASPYMFKPGSPGFDVRLLADRIVVTRVTADSTQGVGDLLPGSVILRIDDRSVADIIAAAPIYPPYNDRYKHFLQTEEVLRSLYGRVGTPVQIVYQDADGQPGRTDIVRSARENPTRLAPELPPVFLECERSMLPDAIGYLHFNAFQPAHPVTVLAALDSLHDADALIIDLRGNNGGSTEAQRVLASRFFPNTVVGVLVESRHQTDTLFFGGDSIAFTGPVAVLVDELSVSGAELFPGCLQSLGRAVIVGVQTPGAVMGGNLEFVTDSLLLVHPTLVVLTDRGVNLEGVGVTPDIVVQLQREQLLRGVDAQIEAAVSFLKSQLSRRTIDRPKRGMTSGRARGSPVRLNRA